MAPVLGIDLGTTFSAVATLSERGQPETLPNSDGEMLTPSAVYFEGMSAVVGQAALDVAQELPSKVALLTKRSIGQPFFARRVDGRQFRPETLSAIILKKIVLDAQARLGPNANRAVITVPAYFDDIRRKATLDAGRIAGIDVLDVLDEPSAAALSYAWQKRGAEMAASQITDTPQNVLVYDLGGGTFDVTVVKLTKKRFQTLAIEGDVRLGGKDWDDRIVDYVSQQFMQKFGEDPRADEQSLASLQAAAERAKRTLSKVESASITCNHAGHKLAVPLTRADFEKLTRDLLTRTRLTTKQVLQQTGLTWEAIDRILLVGGSTHMPMTSAMVRDLTGKVPDGSLAVSEVVARGAAIHAGVVLARREIAAGNMAGQALAEVVEIAVNAHALGVEVRHAGVRVNDKLILKNTQLPASAERVYRTVADGQPRVRVRVLQGEAQQAEACLPLGECWIDELPPNLPKGSPIRVRCTVAGNGIVDVEATDLNSGAKARATLERAGGLSDDEIAREAEFVSQLQIQ